MRRFLVPALALASFGTAAALAGLGSGGATTTARATALGGLTPIQQRLVSGFARDAIEQGAGPAPNARGQQPAQALQRSLLTGCPVDRGANVRINQDCLNLSDPDLQGRGQAQNETAIAQDPRDPRRMVAASNDYRRGDSNCYSYHSGDGGRSWQDSTPPMGFTRGTGFGGVARQYWQAGGDTSVAWDTKGNAYLSCLMFMRGPAPISNNPDQSSAFYVFRSTGSGGASWNFPARPVAELNDVAGAGNALLDKQYMTIDDQRGSPFQDRIYVTWTSFAADGTAYIYEAYSGDYGESFSAPKLVSTASALCSNSLGGPTPQGPCNANQFSQPFTGPDGALYVVWDNYNVTGLRPGEGDDGSGDRTAAPPVGVDNRGQVLLAKSTDGGNSFSPPVKVADYYDLPDCQTYQGKSPFVACVPEKGETANSYFRAANYPSAAVNPRDPREIDVTFGSYINSHSNERLRNPCVPQGYNPETFQPLYTGVKTAGACNNDIVVSRSTNGGRSFSGGSTDVRSLPAARDGDAQADQFWQWAAFDTRGRLAVSFYDRAYGNDEQTGFSDVSLSGTRDGSSFGTTRVTTSSMPPATQFGGGFFGDYSGLTADDVAHPAWMDTRDPNLLACRDSAGNVTQPPSVCTAAAPNAAQANDQNLYTQSLSIPLK
jgi:hypothetical protein